MTEDIRTETRRFSAADISPHPKPNLTSRFGRLVDRATYVDLLVTAGLILFASSLYFSFAPQGEGLKQIRPNWFDAVYFSLVTFTSLGYGDLFPVGFGRLVAAVDVLAGLALTAVLIGKVASERQASLLMLLHTSDTHKRIAEFSEDLRSVRELIETSASAGDLENLREGLDSSLRLTRGIRSYLIFNSHQAAVLELGNFTALIGLYQELEPLFDLLFNLHQRSEELGTAKMMRRCFTGMEMMERAMERMSNLHCRGRSRSLWGALLERIGLASPIPPTRVEQAARLRAQELAELMRSRVATAGAWVQTGFHPIQIERVLDAFPVAPRSEWPTGVTKVVAQQLGISISVAGRCVDALLKTGKLPKLPEAIPRHASGAARRAS